MKSFEESKKKSHISEFFLGEQAIPGVLSVKFTNKIAEIKMEHRGESLN